MIQTFYNDISSCVLYNGHVSERFTIERGVRQGDPLSPYLFLLVAEMLSAAIKNDSQISGININGTEYLISQYADDTSLLLDGKEETLARVMVILHDFGEVSGLKINKEKTKCI